MLESILIKAVAMEVLERKLARCARKEQADLVMERLGTVCSQWNSVLTTDIFRKKVHRLLEGQETIRFEILDQPTIGLEAYVRRLTTLKDEIFLLCNPDLGPMVINVYDRNNLTDVKDVIPLPGISPEDVAACVVTNCVYILNTERNSPSIFRITKDEEHHWHLTPWLNNLKLPVTSRGPISVSANGDLIILSSQQNKKIRILVPVPGMFLTKPSCIGIYCKYGFMQHRIKLSQETYGFRIINSVIQKSDGNLVLLATNDADKTKLLEIDTTGRILRQYQSSLDAYSDMSFADVYGRILVTGYPNRIELFDPEFNQLEIADRHLSEDFSWSTPQSHFNRERNEIVRIETLNYIRVLSIFRLANE